jgi:hypothetical protein
MSLVKKVIILFAPLRSGHHAFIDWMLGSSSMNALHINNTNEARGWLNIRYLSRRPDYRARCSRGALPIVNGAKKEEVIALMNDRGINTLILNFEDKIHLNSDKSPLRASLAQDFPSAEFTTISFSRDPLNLLASRIVRSSLIKRSDEGYEQIVDTPARPRENKEVYQLIQTTRAFTQEYCRRKMQSDLYVDYYSWLANSSARALVENALGMESSEPPKQATIHGGGSSFGTIEAINPNEQMKRYEMLGDTDIFKLLAARVKKPALRYYDRISKYVDSRGCSDYLESLSTDPDSSSTESASVL